MKNDFLKLNINVINDQAKSKIIGGDGCCGTSTTHTTYELGIGGLLSGPITVGDWDDEGCC